MRHRAVVRRDVEVGATAVGRGYGACTGVVVVADAVFGGIVAAGSEIIGEGPQGLHGGGRPGSGGGQDAHGIAGLLGPDIVNHYVVASKNESSGT